MSERAQKFRVTLQVPVMATVDVEANSYDEALDIAYEKAGEPTHYVGNGGIYRMMGFRGGVDIEFGEVEVSDVDGPEGA